MKAFKKPLTAEEERDYVERYRLGDEQAKDILIERNLRLVAHIVKKYQSIGEDTEDLISIGTIGLIKAVTTFDADKGSRLATYAARCIDNELLMMFRTRKKSSRDVSIHEPIGTDKGYHSQLIKNKDANKPEIHNYFTGYWHLSVLTVKQRFPLR